MKPKDIEVGKTYTNKGKGRTVRRVLDIGNHLDAPWFSSNKRPAEHVVKYIQEGREYTLYLSSFASWCGREVEGGK